MFLLEQKSLILPPLSKHRLKILLCKLPCFLSQLPHLNLSPKTNAPLISRKKNKVINKIWRKSSMNFPVQEEYREMRIPEIGCSQFRAVAAGAIILQFQPFKQW